MLQQRRCAFTRITYIQKTHWLLLNHHSSTPNGTNLEPMMSNDNETNPLKSILQKLHTNRNQSQKDPSLLSIFGNTHTTKSINIPRLISPVGTSFLYWNRLEWVVMMILQPYHQWNPLVHNIKECCCCCCFWHCWQGCEMMLVEGRRSNEQCGKSFFSKRFSNKQKKLLCNHSVWSVVSSFPIALCRIENAACCSGVYLSLY